MLIPFSGKLLLEPNSSQRQLHPFHLDSLLFPAAAPPPSCCLRQVKSCLCPMIDPLLGPQSSLKTEVKILTASHKALQGLNFKVSLPLSDPLPQPCDFSDFQMYPDPSAIQPYFPPHQCIFLPFPDIHTPTLEQRQ